MKFVAIADTHGQHAELTLPEGDVIIHAGDVSKRGTPEEIKDFLNWFQSLDFSYKIFIAGNHDFYFERASAAEIKALIPDHVIYLNDSGTRIGNINIWGSPVTPWYHDWAFNRHPGETILKHWEMIPADTTILITHGPVFGKLDRTIHGKRVGCEDLLSVVQQIKPVMHICGHIHEGYGQSRNANTLFINVSVLDEQYRVKNEPVVFEL